METSRVAAGVLAALTGLAGIRGLSAQTPRFFHATEPLEEHDEAELLRPLAGLLTTSLNRGVDPPARVELTSDRCDAPWAERTVERDGKKDRATGRVVFCSGLAGSLRSDLDAAGLDPARRDSAVVASVLFVYAHEVGHLMVELAGDRLAAAPALGSEEPRLDPETAADQFAALTLRSRPRLVAYAAAYWASDPPVDGADGEREGGLLDLGPLARERPERVGYGTGLGPTVARDSGPARYRTRHGFDTARGERLLCWVRGSERPPTNAPAPDSAAGLDSAARPSSGARPDPASECRARFEEAWDRWELVFYAPVDFPRVFETVGAETGGTDGPPTSPADTIPREAPDAGPDEEELEPFETEAGEAPRRATRFWSRFDFRVGDYAALLLPHFLAAQAPGLPERENALAHFDPGTGDLVIEIHGGARTPEGARDLVEDYWDFVQDRFRPYVERRFGPRIRRGDVRIRYYDATGERPEKIADFPRDEGEKRDPSGEESGGGETGRTPPWGEAEGLADRYPVRAGDVAALLLARVVESRKGDLPGRVISAYAPSGNFLDVAVFGDEVSRDSAWHVLRGYRRLLGERVVPEVLPTVGPLASAERFRFYYYAMKGDPKLIYRLEPVGGDRF